MAFSVLLFTLVTLVLSLLAWIYYRHINFFDQHGVVYRKTLPALGSMLRGIFQQVSMYDMMQETYDLHPTAKYVGFYNLRTPSFLIRDEELIKSLAIKNFDSFTDHWGLLVNEPIFNRNLFSLRGDKWRHTRNVLSPAFTANKMKMMFQSISDCAEEYAKFVQETLTLKVMIDTKDTFRRFTVDVIALYAYGIRLNSVEEPDNTFYRFGRGATDISAFRFMFHVMANRLCPGILRLFGFKLFSEEKVRFFQGVIENSIKERLEKKIYRPDMIQLMMEAREGDEGTRMSIEDMTAQAFVFFLGGFESTSNVMCMVAQMLAVHPEVQEKLQREIDRLLEEHQGALQYEHLHEFAYLEAVIQEVNRLHSPAPFLERICVKDFELPASLPGAKPVPIKKGMGVWFPVHALHRDSKYFEDPEKFDPERFVAMNESKSVPFVYMPFGVGPRACIGTRFALMEIKLLLIHILSRCDFVPCEKTEYPFKLVTRGFSITPKNGFWLSVRNRQKSMAK